MTQANQDLSLTLTCTKCGSKNSVLIRHMDRAICCRKCKEIVSPVAQPLCVNSSAFLDLLRGAPVPILAVFFDLRSAPCRVAAPDVHRLAREMAGRAIVVKIDADICPELAITFGVHSFPHFVLLRNSETLLECDGAVPESEIRRWLQPAARAESLLGPRVVIAVSIAALLWGAWKGNVLAASSGELLL